MAKPKASDWIKYYGKYAHVKLKRAGLWTLVYLCLPCTFGMSAMWTDNAPWWELPKRPDAGEREHSPAGSTREA
ncbi:hypothetical protein VDGL01_01422 [Verticillium dahliae]